MHPLQLLILKAFNLDSVVIHRIPAVFSSPTCFGIGLWGSFFPHSIFVCIYPDMHINLWHLLYMHKREKRAAEEESDGSSYFGHGPALCWFFIGHASMVALPLTSLTPWWNVGGGETSYSHPISCSTSFKTPEPFFTALQLAPYFSAWYSCASVFKSHHPLNSSGFLFLRLKLHSSASCFALVLVGFGFLTSCDRLLFYSHTIPFNASPKDNSFLHWTSALKCVMPWATGLSVPEV